MRRGTRSSARKGDISRPVGSPCTIRVLRFTSRSVALELIRSPRTPIPCIDRRGAASRPEPPSPLSASKTHQRGSTVHAVHAVFGVSWMKTKRMLSNVMKKQNGKQDVWICKKQSYRVKIHDHPFGILFNEHLIFWFPILFFSLFFLHSMKKKVVVGKIGSILLFFFRTDTYLSVRSLDGSATKSKACRIG